ncbi:MAG: alanine--tRNA ligase [Candidatus Diapherotrites archaeon]
MLTDKEIKAIYKEQASKEPTKNYPTKKLQEKGFTRKKCENCGRYYWTQDNERKICGDATCCGGYSFIGDPPTKKKFDYLSTWTEFKNYFTKLGYYEYKRYPVVARWRPDVYWVGASIYPFQPFVVKGEIKPKSNAVIIPQLSLRFNDIDNVGITGSHYVCFDMLGQLHFEKAKDYNTELYFEEYFNWITKVMGITENELTIHEDAWAGGGTFGPCMEFFSRGMEIGNQVYMQYEQTENGWKELAIKVLDMGQGHERVPWLTTGKSNSYETTFPSVIRMLYETTGYKPDETLMQKFLPYSALLNMDEIQDVEKAWESIAKAINVEKKELKEKIQTLAQIYSIAEHSRAALVAINDNALPSNVGGGYNLRIVIRRALGFIEDNGWKIELPKLVEEHAKFLKPMYPELSHNLQNVNEILENERKKYFNTKTKSKQVIETFIKKHTKNGNLEYDMEDLLNLYDSQGIRPEEINKILIEKGIYLKTQDFYSRLAERHEKKEQKTQTKKEEKINLPELKPTEILYYGDWQLTEFTAKVIHSKDNIVILDRTAFYPTSGGQIHDTGYIENQKVIDVFKQEEIIIHVMQENNLKEGQIVKGKVDFERRKQLMQHHTSAHLVNLCASEVLGPHVWQAGAAKTLEKGRLDITHYDQISQEQLQKIENCCNQKIKRNLPVKKEIMPREEAEEKYGMHIYQGGFVPGRNLRIVTIDKDVEACGGTHANYLGELEKIKIINSTKIQDGIIRINYFAGNAAKIEEEKQEKLLQEIAEILKVKPTQVPARAEELFKKWKEAKKAKAKNQIIDTTLKETKETQATTKEILEATAKTYSTQPEHLPKTLKRFLQELEKYKN